jgi:hypothetical protein
MGLLPHLQTHDWPRPLGGAFSVRRASEWGKKYRTSGLLGASHGGGVGT